MNIKVGTLISNKSKSKKPQTEAPSNKWAYTLINGNFLCFRVFENCLKKTKRNVMLKLKGKYTYKSYVYFTVFTSNFD